MSRRSRWLVLTLLGSLGAGAGGLLSYQFFYLKPLEEALERPYAADRGAVLFRIGRGSTAETIANRLEASGIVADRRVFLRGVTRAELGSRLQAGLYRFEGPLTPVEVIARIVDGEVATLPVTLPEGLDREATAAFLAQQGAGNADALFAAFSTHGPPNASSVIWIPRRKTLRVISFPVPTGCPRRQARTRWPRCSWASSGRSGRSSAAAGRRNSAARCGKSPPWPPLSKKRRGARGNAPSSRRCSGTASSAECRCSPTRPCSSRCGRRAIPGTTSGGAIWTSTPRTTPTGSAGYRRGPSLPSGSRRSTPCWKPAETDFLYFVSKNDGTHVFSRTLREHNRAVRNWQVDYFR